MEVRFFHTRPDLPWDLPNLLYNAYRFFPGIKAAEGLCYHPLISSDEVKDRVEL